MSTLSIRIPDSIHAKVKEIAKTDNVSINQFISSAIGEKIAALETENYLEKRGRLGSKETVEGIFINPPPANINWTDIESLLIALGAEISEGNGSRVRIKLGGIRAVLHRPHPQKETDKGSVKSIKRFLEDAGVKP